METGVNDIHVVRLREGEEIISSLVQYAQERQVTGPFWAIGALDEVEYAFFDREKGGYDPRRLKGFMEIVSLMGNITRLEGDPVVHCHIHAVSPSGERAAGHLLSARVSVTCEVFLITARDTIERVQGDGFNPLRD